MKNCFIALILTFCMTFTLFIGVDASTVNSVDIPIKLISDNKIIDTETVVVSERVLIPVRKLLESVNATVDWDNATKRVDLTRNGKKISMHIGSNILVTSDGNKEMDVAPILHNGNTTYAPIRAIAEEFDLSVDWDNGTKTILITSPEGCPYVDFYDGMTVEEALEEFDVSPDEFKAETGLDYYEYKDTLYIQAENDVATGFVAKSNDMTFEELKDYMRFDDTITPDTPWGITVGSISFGDYINAFLAPESYGLTVEEVFNQIKNAYNLGNEYTSETKFRYIRTVIDTIDYKGAPKPQSDIIIPDLTEGAIELDFLYKLIDKVGNGKLVLDCYTLPYGQIANISRVEDGVLRPFSSHVDHRVAFTFSAVDVVTADGAPANEIEAFYQAFRDALLANDFKFVKTDEDGYSHYVKDSQEFEIKNIDNKSFDFRGATSYLSCCANGSN